MRLLLALAGNLRPGDELLSPVGKPYDTLEEVIGIRPIQTVLWQNTGFPIGRWICWKMVLLILKISEKRSNEKTKLVTIQRSKGYQTRPTLSVARIGQLIAFYQRDQTGCDLHGG